MVTTSFMTLVLTCILGVIVEAGDGCSPEGVRVGEGDGVGDRVLV